VRSTTIAFLVSRPAPSSLPATRLPFERHVFGMINMSTTVSGEPGPAEEAVLRSFRVYFATICCSAHG